MSETVVPRPKHGRILLATTHRVLAQLRHDPRTIALLLAAPVMLMGLLAWILEAAPGVFDQWGASLLGIFPIIVMFLITSVATLRERTSGTLERLMTTPMAKVDFLGGYAIAFGIAAAVQAIVVSVTTFGLFGLEVAGPVAAMLSALLPLTYAVNAMQQLTANPEITAETWRDIAVLGAFIVALLIGGATTLRRRTP